MVKRIYIFFVSFFLTLSAAAQTLSLDSCLNLARANSRTIQSAELSVEQAKQVKQQALTKYFPQISGSAVGYHSLHPIVDVPLSLGAVGDGLGLPSSLGFLQYGYWAGVTAVQPVFVGGKIVNGNRLAQVGVEAAQLQQQMTERDQLESVEQTFWLIVGLQDKQTTLATTLQLLDTIHHLVTTSVQAGIALQSDLLQVEMRQSELNRMQVQLANGITLASQALCQAIGINYSDTFHVVNDTLLLTDSYLSSLLFPFEGEVGKGLRDREGLLPPLPENRLLALQTRANKLRYRMTLADALPQVAVAATYGYGKVQADILHELGHDKGNGAVMVTVAVPLSGWWETGHKLKEQRLAIQRAQLEQEDKSELLALRTQQNYQQWVEAHWMVQAAQTALQQAQENYRLAYLNYQAGMNTITDLLTATALLDKAHNDYTDALIQRRLAYRHYHSK